MLSVNKWYIIFVMVKYGHSLIQHNNKSDEEQEVDSENVQRGWCNVKKGLKRVRWKAIEVRRWEEKERTLLETDFFRRTTLAVKKLKFIFEKWFYGCYMFGPVLNLPKWHCSPKWFENGFIRRQPWGDHYNDLCTLQ